MMPKDHPCRRTCPNRTPGCNCEKRTAWKQADEEKKEKTRRSRVVDEYQKEAVRDSVKKRVKRNQRVK